MRVTVGASPARSSLSSYKHAQGHAVPLSVFAHFRQPNYLTSWLQAHDDILGGWRGAKAINLWRLLYHECPDGSGGSTEAAHDGSNGGPGSG